VDIFTPKGIESLKQEREIIEYVSKKWKVSFIETDKDSPSCCDGFIINKKNTIIGLYEVKCRNLDLDEFESFGSWLITHEKIKKCKMVSKLLCVPFIGFLYLIKSNLCMYWKITDKDGNYLFNFDIQDTLTQETINGGEIVRKNAYLPIKFGKYL
jgi:hypothetical protein